MNCFGPASLNTAGRRFVEAFEKPLPSLVAVMRFTNCDAYAIPPCVLPKNVTNRSINVELGIKVPLSFESCGDIMRELIHAFSRFKRRYSWPYILADCFTRIVRGLVFEDDDRSDRLTIFGQLQLQTVESFVRFDNMRRPRDRAVALLMRGNPRNRLEYPTVSMPRVLPVYRRPENYTTEVLFAWTM